MNPMDIVLGVIGIALSVMIFSYLLGDNFFFRAALYILVGVSSGYAAAVLVTKVILPRLVEPLSRNGTDAFWLGLVPFVLCVLLVLSLCRVRFESRHAPWHFWLAPALRCYRGHFPGHAGAPMLSVVNVSALNCCALMPA
jgi:hypothetical protein